MMGTVQPVKQSFDKLSENNDVTRDEDIWLESLHYYLRV